MKWFMELFRDEPPTEFSVPSGVNVYIREDEWVIAAEIVGITGRMGPGNVVSVPAGESEAHVVGAAVIDMLAKSRQGVPAEEFDLFLAHFFARTHVVGWDDIERDWRLILVSVVDDETLSVIPMTRHSPAGYIHNPSVPETTCPPESDAIGRILIDIASRPEPDDVPESPSHT